MSSIPSQRLAQPIAGDPQAAHPITFPVRLFAQDAGPRERFVATAICASAALAAWFFEWQSWPVAAWIAIATAYLAGGVRTLIQAASAIRSRTLDINFLMILAAVVSAALGHWGEGALLLFLFSLSDALERYAVERTRRGITALMDLRPATALVMRTGGNVQVPVGELLAGDEIRVKPGERFPIDGIVIDGASAADESVVTGEPMPVEKRPGDTIFAGTMNANGSLRVRMTKPASESTIARIVRLVEEAQENTAPAQRLIERWQTPYVVGVLSVSLLAMAGHWLKTGEAIQAVQAGMILLVAASPCAVVLASPVAVLAAVTRGAREGVLFKGGSHLERLAGIGVIAFDKTGTLTRGKPGVTSIEPLTGQSSDDLLRIAAALEQYSEHPLSRAVLATARERGLTGEAVNGFSNEPGLGVFGRTHGMWAGVGRALLFDKHGIPLPPELRAAAESNHAGTTVLVYRSDGIGGVLRLDDSLRPEAKGALDALRGMGLKRLVMLTGDRARAADAVAQQLGLSEVRAGLRPGDKLAEIRRLSRDGSGVAMVGDGVNDAPALAAADVGIAMGGAGSDVALETADVVLMRDDLRGLVKAVYLARQARRSIQQSLAFAFSVITLLVAATLFGWLTLPLAVVGHEGSTVLVVLNGLRLLRTPAANRHSRDGVE